MRRKHLLVICAFGLSQIFLYYWFMSQDAPINNLSEKKIEFETNAVIQNFEAIPVLILACDRLGIRRGLNNLLAYRKKHPLGKHKFPIFVSQDCSHSPLEHLLKEYNDEIILITQPDKSVIEVPEKQKKFIGYYKIARHYKWALDQMFVQRQNNLVIIVEDDLDVAVDFFNYFEALAPVLIQDKTLICVSAWNDNGKPDLIDTSRSELLYRTHFFPGLGWMLTKSFWEEIQPIWPKAYWDEFLRTPEVRKNRSCIRPEVSRTITFGRVGVSEGQFFDSHLRFMHLNQNPVVFQNINFSYLKPKVYDAELHKKVYYEAAPITLSDLKKRSRSDFNTMLEYRLDYKSKLDFLKSSKQLGVMSDFKYGVPRTAYNGIVSTFYQGLRIYLAPPKTWSHYDLQWV